MRGLSIAMTFLQAPYLLVVGFIIKVDMLVDVYDSQTREFLSKSLRWTKSQSITEAVRHFCSMNSIGGSDAFVAIETMLANRIHEEHTKFLNEISTQDETAGEIITTLKHRPWKFLTSEQLAHVLSHNNTRTTNGVMYAVDTWSILNHLWELGYLNSREGILVLPKYSVWLEDRLPTVLQYLNRRLDSPLSEHLESYFTLYDGWREHTEPQVDPLFELLSVDEILAEGFIGRGSAQEPGRFINEAPTKPFLFPLLNLSLISFSRHKGDPSVMLMPDTEFLSSNGYESTRREIDDCDCRWENKLESVIWRGHNHGVGYQQYNRESGLLLRQYGRLFNQRELLVLRAHSTGGLVNAHNCTGASDHGYIGIEAGSSNGVPVVPVAINISFIGSSSPSDFVSRCEQLRHKYQIDVDGEVNAWSGLWWKLYSNSVVFKVESHVEQWYYKDLVPWTHFIPIRGDLTDWEDKLRWAVANPGACRRIAEQGRAFAAGLTMQRVVTASGGSGSWGGDYS